MAYTVILCFSLMKTASDTYKKDVRARYSKLLWDGDV